MSDTDQLKTKSEIEILDKLSSILRFDKITKQKRTLIVPCNRIKCFCLMEVETENNKKERQKLKRSLMKFPRRNCNVLKLHEITNVDMQIRIKIKIK